MTTPTRTPLGPSTTNRMWYLDVDTNGDAANPNWVAVMGMTEFQPNYSPNNEDDSDFDSSGFQSETKTAEKWSLPFKVGRKVLKTDHTAYDPGQEFIRSKGLGKMGVDNSVHVRWYEMTENGPREEAYDGWAGVTWAPDGGAMTALNIVSVTLTGQGAATPITHPDSGAAADPAITSITPSTGPAAGGDLVSIQGSNFSGATDVDFGATPATDFQVINSTLISAITPAGSAGATTVTVTTPVGTSATEPYTYT